MPRGCIAALVAVAILLPGSAHAQTEPPPDPDPVLAPVGPAASRLGVVIVAAEGQIAAILDQVSQAMAGTDPVFVAVAGGLEALQAQIDGATAQAEPVTTALLGLTDPSAAELSSVESQIGAALAQQEPTLVKAGEALRALGPALTPLCLVGGYAGVVLLPIPKETGASTILAVITSACSGDGEGEGSELPPAVNQIQGVYGSTVASLAIALEPLAPVLQPAGSLVCAALTPAIFAGALSPSAAPIVALVSPWWSTGCFLGVGPDPTAPILALAATATSQATPAVEGALAAASELQPVWDVVAPLIEPSLEGPCSLVPTLSLVPVVVPALAPVPVDVVIPPLATMVCPSVAAPAAEEEPIPSGDDYFGGLPEVPDVPVRFAPPVFVGPVPPFPPGAAPGVALGPPAASPQLDERISESVPQAIALALALLVSAGLATQWRRQRRTLAGAPNPS